MKKRYLVLIIAAGLVIGFAAAVFLGKPEPEMVKKASNAEPGTLPWRINVVLDSAKSAEVTYEGETYKITKKSELRYLTKHFDDLLELYLILPDDSGLETGDSLTFYNFYGDRICSFPIMWDRDYGAMNVYYDGGWYWVYEYESDFAFWLKHRRTVDETLEN